MEQLVVKKYFSRLFLVLLAASVFAGVSALLLGDFANAKSKILFTSIALAVSGITGMCCWAIYFTPYKVLSIAGITVSLLSLALNLTTIWINVEILKTGWKVLEALVVLSVAFANVSLLLLHPSLNKCSSYLKTATISCICILTGILLSLISDVFSDEEYFYRLLGALAVLDVAGTIATVSLNYTKNSSK